MAVTRTNLAAAATTGGRARRVRRVRFQPAIDDFSASLTVTRLSSTTCRVTFSRPMIDSPVARWAGAFVFADVDGYAPTVLEVTPELTDGAVTSVVLQTTEQGPNNYPLTIYGMEVT